MLDAAKVFGLLSLLRYPGIRNQNEKLRNKLNELYVEGTQPGGFECPVAFLAEAKAILSTLELSASGEARASAALPLPNAGRMPAARTSSQVPKSGSAASAQAKTSVTSAKVKRSAKK